MMAAEEGMKTNRSAPRAEVIAVLTYRDVHEAAKWLCEAFGFRERLRIADHRVQLHAGTGAVIVREMRAEDEGAELGRGVTVMVRVRDIDAHCAQARARGARIPEEPKTQMYGERQYNAVDYAGYSWTFTETVEDVDPASWGGELVAEE